MQGGEAGTVVWALGFTDLDTNGFLQCRVVMVKGEATTPSNTCGMNRGSHRFFVLYRNSNKIHLNHDHSQRLYTSRGSQNRPILFLEGGEGNRLQRSQLLCLLEKIFSCNDLSRE